MMSKNSDIYLKVKNRLKKDEDISIEMARIAIENIFRDNLDLKEDICKAILGDKVMVNED